MASREYSWSDRIRALIEEVDRVRGESERVRRHADRAMRRPFWPERRREPRFLPVMPDENERPTDA
jgi:hypothetical protein